jgi:hypothetical protein
MMDMQQNSTVLCLGSPDRVRYSEHGDALWNRFDWAQVQSTVAPAGKDFQISSLFATGTGQALTYCGDNTWSIEYWRVRAGRVRFGDIEAG